MRKIAIGSLVPLSISSVARTRSRTVIPPTRIKKNTAAASVGLTMAPISSAWIQSKPNSRCAATAVIEVVSSTPTVASARAGPATDRKVRIRVAKPLSNRITASATEPTR